MIQTVGRKRCEKTGISVRIAEFGVANILGMGIEVVNPKEESFSPVLSQVADCRIRYFLTCYAVRAGDMALVKNVKALCKSIDAAGKPRRGNSNR